MRKIDYKITKEHENLTVHSFLKQVCGYSSRTIIKLKGRRGGLTCNGEHIRTVDILKEGDVLSTTFFEDTKFQLPNKTPISPVYEDEDYAVFDKPHDMPVHPSILHPLDTLANCVSAYFNSKGVSLSFRPIYRLDRNTTGLVLIAKNQHAAASVKNISKTYYALVCGTLEGNGIIDFPIGRKDDSIIERCVCEDGKPSITQYEVISSNDKYSFVKITLLTGRTHQIRVHFAHIGHPLVGDTLYGENTDAAHHLLHCGSLCFTNGITGKVVRLESNIPFIDYI